MIKLVHGRIELALHEVRAQPGPQLLLLHALRGSSNDWTDRVDAWPGAVFALDFAGHGESGWLAGGGYHPELFAADADAALAKIGSACIAGAGIGAYVALLLAGARRDLVPAALLLPGEGLAGGGAVPDFAAIAPRFRAELDRIDAPADSSADGSDPLLRSAEFDVRPPDYALSFAERARRLLLVQNGDAPPWWDAVRGVTTSELAPSSLDEALTRLEGLASAGAEK